MTHLLAIVASFVGFFCLCATMARHQKDVLGRHLPPRTRSILRVAGWFLLAAALAIDVIGLGGGYGAIAWFGHLTIGAALVLARLTRSTAKAKASAR